MPRLEPPCLRSEHPQRAQRGRESGGGRRRRTGDGAVGAGVGAATGYLAGTARDRLPF